MLTGLLGIVEDNPDMLARSDRESFLQAGMLNRILERLLAGLVLLRGAGG